MMNAQSISFPVRATLVLSILTLVQNNAFSDVSDTEAKESALFSDFRELPVAVRYGARDPDLAVTREGQPFLSWQEPDENGDLALRVSALTDSGWSTIGANRRGTAGRWISTAQLAGTECIG